MKKDIILEGELDKLSILTQRKNIPFSYFPIIYYYRGNLLKMKSKDSKWKIVDDS